ncbi:MAG: hypothetical protein BM560_01020 [Roseobacter sp. MedPE-SWde]|nr:MAG: hypothetical protein BM560_01020 [Roseobacter sp. MedPE-SWde]
MTNHASDQEFTLDHGFETPEPFDRAIANLDMRCTANSVGNGMSLMVTASFGSDYVNIDLSDGGKLEVKCEIQKAMIVAKPYKCDFTDLELEDVRGGFRYKQEFSAKRSHSQVAQTSLEGGASAQVDVVQSGKASAKSIGKKATSSDMEDTYCTKGGREYDQVQFGTDQITIHGNPDGAPLEGNLVNRVTCFRVVPHAPDQPYGVLMQLLVRRGGMRLTDPEPIKLSDRLHDVWNRVFGGSDRLDKFHREAFQLLLQHLIEAGLQSETNAKDAVLAARAIRAVPVDEGGAEHRHLALTQKPIILPVSTVECVLSDAPDKVVQVLRETGVDVADLTLPGRQFLFHMEGEETEDGLSSIRARQLELEVELRNYCRTDFIFLCEEEGGVTVADKIYVNSRVMRIIAEGLRKAGVSTFGRQEVKRARKSIAGIEVEVKDFSLRFSFLKGGDEPDELLEVVDEFLLLGEWLEVADGFVRQSSELRVRRLLT